MRWGGRKWGQQGCGSSDLVVVRSCQPSTSQGPPAAHPGAAPSHCGTWARRGACGSHGHSELGWKGLG